MSAYKTNLSIPATTNTTSTSTNHWVQHSMMQKDADNAIPFTYGKTSWRIQEVRGIFALMREEYEASKKMIITRRYRDLRRIIEMFTAEAITDKLHNLLSTESEQRHTKAKLGSQDRSKKTAILACKENSNITHRGSFNFKSNSYGGYTGSLENKGSTKTRTYSDSRLICSPRNEESGENRQRKNNNIARLESRGSFRSNQTSQNSDNVLLSAANNNNKESESGLWWRQKHSNNQCTAPNSLALTVLKNNLINSNEARLSQHCPQSATTGGFYVKPRSLGVPPISSTYPHSSNVTRENNGIADNLGQACSEAYTFVAAKISLNGMKPISVVLSRWLGAETQNWKLRNTICSRQATETPNSPVVSRRLSLERKYRTKYSSPLASPSKPKACDALSVKSADLGDSLSTRSTVCQISNSDMSNKRIWDRLENGGCLEPKEQTRVLSLSPRTDVSSRCTDSMVDNIVLTIAYDHIIKLRDEYSKLNGKNVWCRYKKMKAMIKSCMRVLNSGQ